MSSRIETAYKYCESVTRTHAKSFYFAAKFLPKEKQRPIYALYALCRHVDDEVDEAEIRSENEAAEAVKLWEKQLNKVYAGDFEFEEKQTNGSDSAGEKKDALVLAAWRDLLTKYAVSQNLPFELMQGVLMDTYIKRYQTFDDLYLYCYRVASTVGLMSSEIFGYSAPETLEYAEALGIAMQLTNILRDIGEDAEMDRIYLPQEDLKKFGVTEEQILSKNFNENFVELMKFEIARAREFYRKAGKGIVFLEADTRFTVLLALRLYAKILDEIERQNYNVFARRAHTTKTQKILSIPAIWRELRTSERS